MGQDWKTLSLVIIGAAIIGWWTMRSLSGDSSRRVASPPAAVATMPAAQPTVKAVAEPAAEPPPPAEIPGTIAPPPEPAPAAGGDDESALIVRDLASLSQGLVSDQRIEDRVMPRVNDALDVPGIIGYRRAPDFWQAALGGQAETKQ